jgi:tryptophan 2,3-dioxygenase
MSKIGSSGAFYAEYLMLDDLLAAQHLRSDQPDELQFIIVHQVHELWFKLALRQLERARDALRADAILEAARLFGQVIEVFRNLRGAAEQLQSLPPMAFHTFRKFLATGSGMQSFQFRQIEFLLGNRDPKFVAWVRNLFAGDDHLEQIMARLAEPSVADALGEVLPRHDISDFAALYAHPERCPEIYALADTLSALEHQVILWRLAHIQLVERTIGAGTVGTGGTTHDYLQKAAQARFFPELWAARDELSRRVDAGQVPD